MRTLEIRKSNSLVSNSILQAPFAYIQKQFGYPVESILRQIHCESNVSLGTYPNTFPNTCSEFYWISSDSKTEWIALGVLDSGLYFLYTAYSIGEDSFSKKRGIMNLWVASKYENLIQFGMSDSTYEKYIKETYFLENNQI